MGCIKSKDKGPTMKYRTENTSEPIASHVSHYGPDSNQANQSPAIKGSSVNFNSHSVAPFGGSSGMTPFGGASSSFPAAPCPYPTSLTGEHHFITNIRLSLTPLGKKLTPCNLFYLSVFSFLFCKALS